MSIDQLIMSKQPDVVMANQAKQSNLNDLFSFAAKEGEDQEAFEKRMNDEFRAHLDETNWELIDTGIVIPDVPELAHDDTEEARDELVKLDADLAYCLTFTEWLKDEIFVPCDVLRQTIEDTLLTETPRQEASETE